jgi:hypothetical protein
MFWSIDEKRYNLDFLADDAEKMVNRAKERNVPESDLLLLSQAVEQM